MQLTNEEKDLIVETIMTIYINRGGSYHITEDKLNMAANIITKLSDIDVNYIIKKHEETCAKEKKVKDELERQNQHPLKRLWNRMTKR